MTTSSPTRHPNVTARIPVIRMSDTAFHRGLGFVYTFAVPSVMIVREAAEEDLDGLFALYTQLHDNPVPEKDGRVMDIWRSILENPGYHIIVADVNGVIASTCTMNVIQNLTQNQRPYALIENVVTDRAHRGNGYARACLDFAKGIARNGRCYKIMLMTGSKDERIFRFYEESGYNRRDKTAFVQWIDHPGIELAGLPDPDR